MPGSSLRPFFPYYGSKWNIARYYPPPQYGHVIEPFAGGAGYATFYNCSHVTLVDTDPIIVGVWAYLLRVTTAEILALPEMPEVGDSVDHYTLPQEAKWLMGFWLNRGSAQPKKSRTAYSARTDKAQLNWGRRAKERIAHQLHRLTRWEIIQGDFTAATSDRPKTWFIDPPYGEKGQYYRHTFADFPRLSTWVQTCHGEVIVCEHTSATWLPFVPLGSFKSSRGRAEEAVYHARQ